MSLRSILAASAITLLTVGGASAASVVNLGFALDRSGSVGSSNFGLTTAGLSAALGKIPTTGDVQYRISVVTFSSSARTDIPPVIVTAANKASLQASVGAISYTGGGTDIAEAIDLLTSGFANYKDELSLLNVATDGQSNDSALRTAAANALADGIDGLSYEGITSGVDTNALASACFGNSSYTNPGANGPSNGCVVTDDEDNLPDATKNGFVLEVDTFLDFENAIAAKITQVVDDTGGGTVVPLPAAGWMLIAGFGALMGLGRRRKNA